MPGGATIHTQIKILEQITKKTSWTAPAACYVALFTATPSDSGGGTEVTGGSYARQSTTGSTWTSASSASPSAISNAVAINFGTATANWGAVSHFGIFDASSGGNLMVWAPLTTARTVNNTDSANFAIGTLVVTCD